MKNFSTFKTKKKGSVLIFGILSIFSVIQIYPFVWMILFSLKTNQEIFIDNPLSLPGKWVFKNYITAWNEAGIAKYFFNSVFVTTVSLTLLLVLAATTAYAITRMYWKLSKIFIFIISLCLTVPVFPVLLPLVLQYKKLGITDSYWSLILTYTAFELPFAIFIFSSFIKGISKEMEEAACIDGANIYTIFTSIIVPLLKPAFTTEAIFATLNFWNEFIFAITFTSSDAHRTIPVGIMQMRNFFSTNWGSIGAGMVIASIPTLALYLTISNKVQESLLAGAVKG